jgi:DNA-binding NarL/FixJ family response regulator
MPFLSCMKHSKGPHVRLTKRERELIAEIMAGRSNKAIAAKSGVKEQTIKNQLSVLFRKLAVSSRLELAVTFQAHECSRT